MYEKTVRVMLPPDSEKNPTIQNWLFQYVFKVQPTVLTPAMFFMVGFMVRGQLKLMRKQSLKEPSVAFLKMQTHITLSWLLIPPSHCSQPILCWMKSNCFPSAAGSVQGCTGSVEHGLGVWQTQLPPSINTHTCHTSGAKINQFYRIVFAL